jgi:hypothetical protein
VFSPVGNDSTGLRYPVDMNEAQVYKSALDEAEEHLNRWEKLGKDLNKTLDPGWRSILLIRQAQVEQLRMLSRLAEHSL